MSEEQLERALKKLRKLKGEKKKLMIKAVVNYIDSMAGDVYE